MINIKKTLIFLILILIFSNTVFAGIIGHYVHTDIVAYINDTPINSYNIDGWTGVIAEDLISYGFDVVWNAEERTLSVGNAYFPTPMYTHQNLQGSDEVKSAVYSGKKIGSYAGNIYATDIKTYVAGEEVTAFNIGGRTIIYIDELQRFGNVVWHEAERKICYNYVQPWNIDLYSPDYEAELKENVSSFSLEMSKNENGEFEVTGENLDYLDYLKLSYNKKDGFCFGFSIYQRVLFQTEEIYKKLWEVSTVKYDGTELLPTADKANEMMKIVLNGEQVKIKKVTQGKGNGHNDFYFWFDGNIKKEDIKTLSVNFN